MHSDHDMRPRQPRRLRRFSVVTVIALLVAVLFERRARAPRHAAPAVFDHETAEPSPAEAPTRTAAPAPFEPAERVTAFEQVNEVVELEAPVEDAQAFEVDEHPAPSPLTWGFGPAVSDGPFGDSGELDDVRPEVEVDLAPGATDEAAAEVEIEHPIEDAPVAAAAPAPDRWFGSFAPAPWAPSEQPVAAEAVELESEPVAETAVDDEPVVELPAAPAAPTAPGPFRQPPAHLRRYMGTGLSVLLIAVMLGSGVLVSGATADSTSDPSTVPDAVPALADPGVVADGSTPAADTTTTDTTATDTTATSTVPTTTTSTDTTTTDTTTTGTTTTDTTTTATTTTSTTSTDPATTSTTTTATDPSTSTTPAPTDTTAAAPAAPAVDPAPAAADPPAAPAPAPVAPAPTTTPVPTHVRKLKRLVPAAPVETHTTPVTNVPVPATPTTAPATHPVAKTVAPAAKAPAVVTLASGADPIGSLLSRNAAIPAVDASLLPTPAQVSFYVRASKPLAKLPTLRKLDHPTTEHLVRVGRTTKVSWTVLAAVARLESNLGARDGLLAGRRLTTPTTGDGLTDLATFLRAHGAGSNPVRPARSRTALIAYFGSTRKADRAVALAALYGALGSFGLQHGVRAETGRLQRRVLRDSRIHLSPAGRGDIRHGRVDPRVLVTLEYLAGSFSKVGVSDLVSGGQVFSRSGAVSAHLYGRAADVSSLRGTRVTGHQGPGTLTEQAVRRLLLLPKSLRPRQVISLMDVDGPTGNRGSFALPDHYDRIQIDY